MIVTVALCYLAIGGVLLAVLIGIGIVPDTIDAKQRRGDLVTHSAVFLAGLMVMVVWPVVVVVFVMGLANLLRFKWAQAATGKPKRRAF